MNSHRSAKIIGILGLFVVLLTACSAVKAGQVRGKIVDNDGKPIQITVFLAEREAGGTWRIDAELSASTDPSGNFMLAEVPPGEYALVYHDLLAGGFSFSAVNGADGNTVSVTMTADQGVNLGTITLTN